MKTVNVNVIDCGQDWNVVCFIKYFSVCLQSFYRCLHAVTCDDCIFHSTLHLYLYVLALNVTLTLSIKCFPVDIYLLKY